MKKLRILKGVTLLALSLVLLFSLIACGDLKIDSFSVQQSSVKTEYFEGEEIDFSGIKATVKYTDESYDAVLGYSDLTIEYDRETITATVGSKTVRVSYTCPHTGETKTAEVAILVKEDPNAVKHDGYKIDASAVKNSYLLGEELDFSGIKLYETFTNGGADVEITDHTDVSFAYDKGVTATAGIKTVTVSYKGEQIGSFTVNVKDPEDERNTVEDYEVLGSFKNTFEVGDAISKDSFAGLSVLLTYEDGTTQTVTLADMVLSGTVDTASTGKKTVSLTCADPVNDGVTIPVAFEITVIDKKPESMGFEDPDSLTEFKAANDGAGDKVYGDNGFVSQFENQAVYLIGDDNAFKLVPRFRVMDKGTMKTLASFYSNVTVSVKSEGTYTALTAKVLDATKQTIVSFFEGETLIVTVDTYYGKYEFEEAAVGKEIKISVLPSDSHYHGTGTLSPVTLEAKIIDAYNVYEAKELSIFDNVNDEWNDFKAQNGLDGISAAGIVLHGDIHITAADVPDSFFYTLGEDIVYTNSVTGAEKTILAGTKFLKDELFIYNRQGEEGFAIEGNFFTLDIMSFPLVPSPDAYEKCGGADTEYTYWNDFSNSALFSFAYRNDTWDIKPSVNPVYTLNNLRFIGNAGRDNLLDAKGHLVSAGGLIFMKPRNYVDTTVTNTNVVSSFISFLADMHTTLRIEDSKCYDSYQNAFFVWGTAVCEVKDSYLVGAGGPLIIAQSVYRDDWDPQWYNVTVELTNTVTETSLTGQEIWFAALGATPIVTDQVAPLLSGLGNIGAGQFIDESKMNIVAALLTNGDNGTDLAAIVGNKELEGTVSINGSGLDRWKTDPLWQGIYGHPAFSASAPFLTVVDAEGNNHVIFFNGTTFCDAMGNALGTDASHGALVAAFASAEYITLSQGGMTIVFEAVK